MKAFNNPRVQRGKDFRDILYHVTIARNDERLNGGVVELSLKIALCCI